MSISLEELHAMLRMLDQSQTDLVKAKRDLEDVQNERDRYQTESEILAGALNAIWSLMYPKGIEWEYPGQVAHNVKSAFLEAAKIKLQRDELIERLKPENAEQLIEDIERKISDQRLQRVQSLQQEHKEQQKT